MINFLNIQNFKTLKNASFALSNLNLVTGLNSTGKSTLIQSILLLMQAQQNKVLNEGLLLNGSYISLGTGKDVLCYESDSSTIKFTLNCDAHEEPLVFDYQYKADSDFLPLNDDHSSAIDDSFSIFNNNFQYLSAQRLSPRSNHLLSDYNISRLNSLGNNGEYTVHYIAVNQDTKLAIAVLQHPKAKDNTLLANIDAWMSEIASGIKVIATVHSQFNMATLSYKFEHNSSIELNPQNVGFGINYALPIVTAILRAKKNDLLMIEDPEAHLHAAAQSMLGKLCAIAAENGVQLIVASHSDHFFNGIRVAVKENIIKHNKIDIFFLAKSAT